MLTGTIAAADELAADDFRRRQPRFAEGAFDANRALVDDVAAIAAAHGATPGQVALAWVLAQGDDIDPDPGDQARSRTSRRTPPPTELTLTADDLARLDGLSTRTTGARSALPGWINRTTRAVDA